MVRSTAPAPTVPPQEAHRMVRDGASLVDVRESYEWASGHAPDAVHVPLDSAPELHRVLDRSRRVLVVCRSGQRAGHAATMLRRLGYDALNVDGGMQSWAGAGLPVVTDAGVRGQVA